MNIEEAGNSKNSASREFVDNCRQQKLNYGEVYWSNVVHPAGRCEVI